VPSLIGRAIKLARSPAGKRLVAEAQKAARDPKNKARIEQLRERVSKKSGGGSSPGEPRQEG
jgi:hypothetical protein